MKRLSMRVNETRSSRLENAATYERKHQAARRVCSRNFESDGRSILKMAEFRLFINRDPIVPVDAAHNIRVIFAGVHLDRKRGAERRPSDCFARVCRLATLFAYSRRWRRYSPISHREPESSKRIKP